VMPKHRECDATRENPWLVIIIPLYNETPRASDTVPGWLSTTRVEHRAGGKITLKSSGHPEVGWPEYWRQYRAEHPEYERFWRGAS
jgi:hypothetical protein